ncbi:DUF6339 family protein [Melissococcus sp. OM08-11BH]|uniref:DUF6339 family protein n=1 Tax=Melissococcus sp. OM08-11BH TaxID=2293110 RepID=UPI000E4A8E87|nr:DUF6339 family protein [Melissococcus sp. OM08-11BH]RGI29682.1 hypothetical protein DXC12_07335 [Melissococcus sp. OM08-11BH]
MMISIKYCSEEFLQHFKANFEVDYLPMYLDMDREKIKSVFNNEIVMSGDLCYEYHPLVLRSEVEGASYININAKIIYNSLKNLTTVQATKEELWFTLMNTVYLDYLLDSISVTKGKNNFERQLKNMLFFTQGNIRSLVSQHLSKLWWIGYRTYDSENVTNEYWLTDYFCRNDASGKAITFFASKFTNNRDFALGIIEAIKYCDDRKIVKNQKETYSFINEHFNFIGGVKVLDMMTRQQVVDESIRLIESLADGTIEISENKRKKILLNT